MKKSNYNYKGVPTNQTIQHGWHTLCDQIQVKKWVSQVLLFFLTNKYFSTIYDLFIIFLI